ncbi:MAG: hypothetical protein GOU99_02275 [Candidatus Altiarchaeota archaeon]|nr:hypothetical protein [Candidatus Altiarchaeota archaeon]
MALLKWRQPIADFLSRVFGAIMIANGLGLWFSSYGDSCTMALAVVLEIGGFIGLLLPDTVFWKKQFKK